MRIVSNVTISHRGCKYYLDAHAKNKIMSDTCISNSSDMYLDIDIFIQKLYVIKK